MTSEALLTRLKNNPFLLAPMASITDTSFRSYMKRLGVDIVISELVSANGIRYGGEKTLKLMEYKEQERPVGLQLFGENIENLAYSAAKVEEMGYDFIDMNFGCPVKKVVQKGAGSAILKDLVQLRNVLRAVKGATSLPVTIKIRTGWTQEERNAPEVCQVAYDEGITWVAIHGRTRSQAYTGEADWAYISEVKEKSPLPIIGNGDLNTPDLAVSRLKQSGCDGVMIGRGCLKNPWIFQDSLRLLEGKALETERNHVPLLKDLYREFRAYHSERLVIIQLRKFAMWYSAGFRGSAQFRKDLFKTQSLEETLEKTLEYYSELDHLSRTDTTKEAFLMGGHG